tara:strand:+ start:95 stop:643 length:549 start_codon:yes stop_codon:yes gene_type:complete
MSNPISTTELMQHLRFTADASELTEAEIMIGTATAFAEQYTGRKLSAQTVVMNFESLSSNAPLKLTGGPVSSITSVQYYDSSFNLQTLTDYRIIHRNGIGYLYPVIGGEWPTDVATADPETVTITYVVGMSSADAPSPVKSAILLIAASLWENRENEIVGTNIKSLKPILAAKDLLHPYKLR